MSNENSGTAASTATDTPTSRQTALYAEHEKLGAFFTDFGGWQMPLKYESELAEHKAVRETAGLFDLSHMGEVRVTGPQAAEFLDYALVGKLSAVKIGRAKYSLLCNADGGIIDDLITYRRGDNDYLVVPNAGNAPAVAAALAERSAQFDVEVQDESTETSLIAVQGPKSEGILLKLVDASQHEDVTELKYYAATDVTINTRGGARGGADGGADGSIDVLLARTGYTGEDGFELYVPNTHAVQLWTALLESGTDASLTPAGLASRDSLRLEAGMPLYGNELSLQTSPYMAGLGPVVALSKEGDFVGRAALEAQQEQAQHEQARKLVGLTAQGRRAARSHYPVSVGGAVVGEVTSGAPSPTLGHPIAMAYVDVAHSEPGTTVEVDLRGKPEKFDVVKLPFYKRSNQARSNQARST